MHHADSSSQISALGFAGGQRHQNHLPVFAGAVDVADAAPAQLRMRGDGCRHRRGVPAAHALGLAGGVRGTMMNTSSVVGGTIRTSPLISRKRSSSANGASGSSGRRPAATQFDLRLQRGADRRHWRASAPAPWPPVRAGPAAVEVARHRRAASAGSGARPSYQVANSTLSDALAGHVAPHLVGGEAQDRRDPAHERLGDVVHRASAR